MARYIKNGIDVNTKLKTDQKVRETVENPDSQFVAMPQTITPAGIELNPITEPIDEPLKEEN